MAVILSMRVLLVLPVPLFLLIFGHAAMAGDISDCEGNNPKAKISACSRLIESGQLDGGALASAHNNQGVGLIRTGQGMLAIAQFDAAIRIDPNHFKARINRGSAYVENGQLDKALIDYNKAIELKPDWAMAYSQRGLVHFFRGNFKPAMADLNKAIDLDPDPALIYNNRGVVHESMGLVEKAIADYRKALTLDPSLDIAETNLRSLLSEAVSAGFHASRRVRPGTWGYKPTLTPFFQLDGVRFGLRSRSSH